MSHTAVAVMGDRDDVRVCPVQGSSQQAVRVSLSWSGHIIVDAAVAIWEWAWPSTDGWKGKEARRQGS